MSYLKIVGFLQLTAELLIGAEDRVFIVHLAPNHHCSMSLQQILGLFDPRYLCMVVEALCLPPTYKNHPVHCLYRIWQRHAPWPDEPPIPAHLDRERNRRWAQHCSNALAERCLCLVHGSTMERERPRMPRQQGPRVHRFMESYLERQRAGEGSCVHPTRGHLRGVEARPIGAFA